MADSDADGGKIPINAKLPLTTRTQQSSSSRRDSFAANVWDPQAHRQTYLLTNELQCPLVLTFYRVCRELAPYYIIQLLVPLLSCYLTGLKFPRLNAACRSPFLLRQFQNESKHLSLHSFCVWTYQNLAGSLGRTIYIYIYVARAAAPLHTSAGTAGDTAYI